MVQANNEYIELQAKEQKEIDRILAEFSAEAAAHREDIQWDYDTLVYLDLIFARGQLSYKMNAVRPEVPPGRGHPSAQGPPPPAGPQDGGAHRHRAGGHL